MTEQMRQRLLKLLRERQTELVVKIAARKRGDAARAMADFHRQEKLEAQAAEKEIDDVQRDIESLEAMGVQE